MISKTAMPKTAISSDDFDDLETLRQTSGRFDGNGIGILEPVKKKTVQEIRRDQQISEFGMEYVEIGQDLVFVLTCDGKFYSCKDLHCCLTCEMDSKYLCEFRPVKCREFNRSVL